MNNILNYKNYFHERKGLKGTIKMALVFKRLRWLILTKSKICLCLLSFLVGYLFHFIIPFGQSNVKTVIQYRDYSSQIGKSNGFDILLAVLIFSSVNNFSRRQMLRETWLSDISEYKDVKHYFVISEGIANEDQKIRLSAEQKDYNDLLIFPELEDSFYLLTPKLIVSFGWLTDIQVLDNHGKSETVKPFSNFKFVLKCDDDTYVRLKEIVQELKSNFAGSKGDYLYWGFFDGRAKPKKSGKYKEDEWDICDYYIPYALGGGYVLAKPLVEYIAKNGNYLKQYKSEDVSVGAWLGTYSNVNRVHDPRFDTEYLSRGCHQTYLITHKHSELAIRNFHNNLKRTGYLCKKEYKTRMSYIYNWQTVPSKCCARVKSNIP